MSNNTKPKQPNIKANLNNPNNPNYKGNKNKNNKRKVRPFMFRYLKPSTLYPNINKRTNPNKLLNNYRSSLKRYLSSLLFPEDAVNSGYIAKQPSYISLPTASVVFKEQINFTITNDRKFYLMWIPNFFSSIPDLKFHLPDPGAPNKLFYSHCYYKNTAFGGDDSEVFWCHSSYSPEISLSKYRLVSAKISVQYNGAVMNQCGQLYSCATYDDLPVLAGAAVAEEDDIPINFDQFTQKEKYKLSSFFDQEKIRNGLWPKFVNITNSVGQIDNIAIPSDPTDHTFFPLTHYYQIEPDELVDSHRQEDSNRVKYALSTDGGHLSYLYYGSGIPEGTNITVIIYYNFEVIPTQTTAPFMRTSKDDPKTTNFINTNKEIINEKINEVASTSTKLLSDGKGNVKNNLQTLINVLAKTIVPASTTAGAMATGFPLLAKVF